jgi:hypothetical protein
MKKFLISFSLAALSILVSACAQIPHSSGVNSGPDMNSGLASDYLYYSPSGPNPGATAAEIVNGFINAGTGPQNDYAVARQFLSKGFSAKWNPGAQTLVQTGRPLLSQDAAHSSFKLTANVITEIDADGEMRKVKATKTLNIHLVQEGGQWRIDSAPNATVLIKPVFDVIFQAYSIYFLDKPKTHLVPDVRWFPSRASTGTKMVAALLEGPNKWLADSVTSAIPSGTKLNTASVTISGGIATVDLSSKALKTSCAQRSLIRSQLYQTLTQLPSVIDVAIEVDRSPQQVSSLNQLSVSEPGSTAYALIHGDIYLQVDSRSQLLSGYRGYLKDSQAYDFALNDSQSEFAALGKDGLYLAFPHTRSAALKLVDIRQNLVSPVIDSFQMLWSMQSDSGHGIRVFDGTKNVASFSPNWMRPLGNKHFAVSPDDARLLVSGSSNGTAYLYAVGISRNYLGVPSLSSTPKLLATRSAMGLDVNWVSPSDVVMVNYSSAGTQTPEQLTVGGDSVNLTPFAASVSLAASAGGQVIYLLTPSTELYTNRNQSWVFVRRAVQAIHFGH